MNKEEVRVPLKKVGEAAKDKAWLERVRKSFVEKFYAASTLATKNAKRKKVAEILDSMGRGHLLSADTITALAAVLDSTGMKAGDQYLG